MRPVTRRAGLVPRRPTRPRPPTPNARRRSGRAAARLGRPAGRGDVVVMLAVGLLVLLFLAVGALLCLAWVAFARFVLYVVGLQVGGWPPRGEDG